MVGGLRMPTLKHFRFWCQSVLPLVYDDSLSYYEVLCKVVEYINKLIDTDKEIINDIDELRADLKIVQDWIANYDEDKIIELFERYVKFVFFGLTEDGYFVTYIPESWNDIQFSTSGYDDFTSIEPEYGHLILSY
jgi:hypothetical protein